MTDLSGQYLGRYNLTERLGEGGMATVYKGYDTRLERDVAVKIIRSAAFPEEELEAVLKRFEREAKSLAKLSQPNIVKVYDYGEHDGSPYLVMEYLPGGTLKKFIGKSMHWQEAMRLLLPIARGVAYAHQRGILHRDIKPANILITEGDEPMLSDFGIAKLFEGEQSTALTGSGMAIGTPEYMAPEQWIGTTSPQSDQYSLGIVLYEMLAGRKPYVGDTPAAILIKQATEPLPSPRKFAVDLPESLEHVLIKALAKEPENRHRDMNAFIGALENLQMSAPVMPPPEEKRIEETYKVSPPEPDVPVPTKIAPQADDVHAVDVSPAPIDSEIEEPSASSPEIPSWVDGDESLMEDRIPSPPSVTSIYVSVPARKSNQGEGRTVKAFDPLPSQAAKEPIFQPVPTSKKAAPIKLTPKRIGLLVGGMFIVLALSLSVPFIGRWFSPSPSATAEATATLALSTQPVSLPQAVEPIQASETSAATSAPAEIGSPTLALLPVETADDKGVSLRLVPEGEFLMGSNDGEKDESPMQTVALESFYIDEYEVTNKLYKLCVDEGVCDPPRAVQSITHDAYYGNNTFADYPVMRVDWYMATAYCKWRVARLPTEAEWEKAARGTDGRTYPWGEGISCSKANYDRCVGDTTRVGTYKSGVSPYGVYDMAGNVWEWVFDAYAAYPNSTFSPSYSGPGYRVFRGGSLADSVSSLRTSNRNWYDATLIWDSIIGFRCAKDATP